MNMHSPEHTKEAGFDLTPMIDVVLLLIIFFAFTAQFNKSLATPVELPKQKADARPDTSSKQSIVIDITREGTFRVAGRDVPLDVLTQMVAADVHRAGDSANLEVIVRADRRGTAAPLNALASELTRVGVKTWKLATEVNAS
ncbi:MAG: hypothetical protein GC200_04050 [Tepidisphaera sp.]|nr:hypothetical protein [Tepidisphaera sp.]